MAVQVGDAIPAVTVKHLGAEGFEEISTDQLFKGKKVVLFGVPGAFTPTCSDSHVPGYVAQADAFKAKGVEAIVCMAVNDPFVMRAWGKQLGVGDKVFLLPDGNGTLTKALDLELDARGFNLGIRSKRFAAVVEDGVIKAIEVEPVPSAVSVSGAEAILAKL